MQLTLFIVWLMPMLSVTAHTKQQQHRHQLMTTIDDYYKYPVCRPGSHLASSEMCGLCAEGHSYTEHYNRDTSCQLCKQCGINEFAAAPCTITRNTRCHCARDFYRHSSGTCISRQHPVSPADGSMPRHRGAFIRPIPWSAGSTTEIAKSSDITFTSSTDGPDITQTTYLRTRNKVDAISGSPLVTDATTLNTVIDACATLSSKITSQDPASVGVTTVPASVAAWTSEAHPTNVSFGSPFVPDVVSREAIIKQGDSFSTVASVATSRKTDTYDAASPMESTKEHLVTTTVSVLDSTEDRKLTSTLDTAAVVTFTSSTDGPDITQATYLWTRNKVEDAISGSPLVTDATTLSTVDDTSATLSSKFTSQNPRNVGVTSVPASVTASTSEAHLANISFESPLVPEAISRERTTTQSDHSSTVASVATFRATDTYDGTSSMVAKKEDLVTTTVSVVSVLDSTGDRKLTSTLDTAAVVQIHQNISSNTVGPRSASESTNGRTTTLLSAVVTNGLDTVIPESAIESTYAGRTTFVHEVVTALLDAASTVDVGNLTSALRSNATGNVNSTGSVNSTTNGTDPHIHGGIVHDDCGMVHVAESNNCLPWKVATGVLIVLVVLQMVVIVILIISGAARRYILRRNMTPSFHAGSVRTPPSSDIPLSELQPTSPSSEVVSL